MKIMQFFSSEQRARSRTFDRIQLGALEALEKSADDEFLGHYHTILRSAIAVSFLPNVRHGLVALPKSQRGLSSTAVLPIMHKHEVEEITFSEDIMRPTPAMLAKRQANIPTLGRRILRTYWQLHSDCQAVTFARTLISKDPYFVHGRSIVCIPQWQREDYAEANITLHEMVHAVDNEWWDVPKDTSLQNDSAASELHAYAVACGPDYEGELPDMRGQRARKLWQRWELDHDTFPELSTGRARRVLSELRLD